jgi:hypothetical protein
VRQEQEVAPFAPGDNPAAGSAPSAASAASPPAKRADILPPSTGGETANVLRAAAFVVAATWIYIANAGGAGGAWGAGGVGGTAGAGGTGGAPGGTAAPVAAGAARDLMPYQRLFASLGGAEQRMFRELQEGLLEAENVRGAVPAGRARQGRRESPGGGGWPAPEQLAAQGVPPFADVALPHAPRYRWTMRRAGLAVGYLGEAADGGAPAWLLLVQEPDPLAPADPAAPPPGAPNDEVHHRLPDGTVLHVGVWMHPPRGAGAAVAGYDDDTALAAPYARGWTQLLSSAPR